MYKYKIMCNLEDYGVLNVKIQSTFFVLSRIKTEKGKEQSLTFI